MTTMTDDTSMSNDSGMIVNGFSNKNINSSNSSSNCRSLTIDGNVNGNVEVNITQF